MQPDKELVVEATGGDREQPGTAARVAHLELCHPAHVCFKVCIDDDTDYSVDDDYEDIDGEGEDEDDYYLELSHPAHVCPKVVADDDDNEDKNVGREQYHPAEICSELPFSF